MKELWDTPVIGVSFLYRQICRVQGWIAPRPSYGEKLSGRIGRKWIKRLKKEKKSSMI